MFLSEIFKDEHKDKKEITGVIVDKGSIGTEYTSAPPENLESIGLVLVLEKDEEDYSIDTDLIDVIINYKLTNMQVILEVPSHLISSGRAKVRELIQLVSNLDISLSLLPPGHSLVDASENADNYTQIISDTMDTMLDKPNFDKVVVPVSNFMEYLMLEKIAGAEHDSVKNFKPTDSYIVDNFSSIMSESDSNQFKNKIREKLHDYYGGEENFNIVAETILLSIQDRGAEILKDLVLKHTSANQDKSPSP